MLVRFIFLFITKVILIYFITYHVDEELLVDKDDPNGCTFQLLII